MENNKPKISQYLLSTCLFIIDELNETYGTKPKEALKNIADDKFNEMDISVKLGYPFRQMVHYTVGDNKKGTKSNHDLYVESKDFKIEVKYLKNWKSSSGTNSASKSWKEYQKDFDWLLDEIRNGNKDKRAFIIGWFNCVGNFSQYLQLGSGSGSTPLANDERIAYFPFLKKLKSPTYTTDLTYNYEKAYREYPLDLIGEYNVNCDCLFLGNEHDCFHFAIYY